LGHSELLPVPAWVPPLVITTTNLKELNNG
jgi:hypothetical protein